MNRILIFAISYLLLSCEDSRLHDYEKLVDKADKMVLSEQNQSDSIIISSAPLLENVREILKRNVHPEPPRKFLAKKSITLYSAHKRMGILMVSYGEKPYVHFHSDSLNFSFQLTYGLGTTLGELLSANSR